MAGPQDLARLERVARAVEGVEPDAVGRHDARVPRVKAGLEAAKQGQVMTADDVDALFDRLDQDEGLAP